MKKINLLLTACFVVLSFSALAQIQVNSSGYTGIGTTPSSSYRLKVGGNSYLGGSSYFNGNSYFYYPVAISGPPANSPYLIVSASSGTAPNVLICGTTTGSYIFTINGSALASGGIWQDSDSKLKKNITLLDGKLMLSKIMNIDGKKYEFKNKEELEEVYSKLNGDTLSKMIPQFPKGEQYGFIAQELEKIFPELLEADSITNLKAINYTGMIPVLLQVVKEQQTQLTQLQQQLAQIESTSSLKSASIATGTTDDLIASRASLDQNNPNPFSRETKIGCFIPESSTTSVLYIYNMNGTQLQQNNVNGKGRQTVTISGNSLQPGMYLYTLLVDGKEVDTKRMILTK